MRPAILFFIFLGAVLFMDGIIALMAFQGRQQQNEQLIVMNQVTEALGLTDLCVATEARYTRHPAVSDVLVPFMDHPGGIEHFPSGSFFAPPDFFSTKR